VDKKLQQRLRAIAPTPEGLLERGLLLARSGFAEHAGDAVLSLLDEGECPLALLDALTPPEVSAFETRVVGERFARPRLGDLAFGPRGEALYCVSDRTGLARLDLSSGAWKELARAPFRIRSLDCDRQPILTYGEGPQPVVRLAGKKLKQLPGPQSHGGRDLLAGFLPGAYTIRGARSLKAYAEAPGKKRAIWSLSVGAGEDAVSLGPGGAASLEDDRWLCFYEFGARKPSHRVDVKPHCPDAARFAFSPYRTFSLRCAGAGAHVLYALSERDHAHGLSWISPSGQLHGRVELPFGAWRWASSPSGRYALVLAQEHARAGPNHFRTHQVFLADLERGEVRELTLPALPGGLTWSRTGRSFAISTEEGTLLLGQTDATVSAPTPARQGSAPSSPEDATWHELYKAQRFWRGRQAGVKVEFHYGARGSAGTQRSKAFATAEAASKDLSRRLRQKLREGYGEP